MSDILTIADLKDLARRRVPKMFFDYADSGAWTESTYRANEEDFQKIKLRQRVLVDMTNRSLETTMIGQKVSMPVALAPTGLTGMQHADGEMLAAQAAEEFGVPFTLSTMSICSIEDVASVTKKPFWFQLYVMRDKDFVLNLIDRAKAAKCSALVLTLDLQILGQRHKDLRNGLSAPPKLTLPTSSTDGDAAALVPGHAEHQAPHLRQHRRPRQERRRPLLAVVLDDGAVRPAAVLEGCRLDQGALGRQADPQGHPRRGRCADGGQDRRRRDHRLQPWRPPARRRAVLDHGAAEEIVDAVGDKIEVHIDGGIRSGQDVLKALCLGAKGTYIGRPFLYGLGAMGKEGVTLALEIIRKEMDITMALCGKRLVTDMGKDQLRR